MPSRRFWLPRRTSVPSSTPPNAVTSGSAPVAPSVLQELPAPLRQAYPDYVGHHTSGSLLDDALAVTSILNDIPTLPLALAALPLIQIANIVSVTVEAVKVMRENREEFAHLVARIVRFLLLLRDHLRASNVSVADGMLAANLHTLKRCVLPCHCTFFALKYLSRS